MERRRLLDDSDSGAINDGPAVEPPPPDESVSFRFWLGVCCAVVVMVHQGFFGGFTSPVIAASCDGDGSGSDGAATHLCSECMNCELNLSAQIVSIFTSEVSLLGIPASVLGGGLADWLGRRRTLVLTSVAIIIGWALVFAAPATAAPDTAAPSAHAALWPQLVTPTALVLLGGRALIAVAACIQVLTASVWIAESCPAAIRGAVMTCISFGWNAGSLGVYALGNVLAWRDLAAGGAVLGCICTIMSCAVVESPRWLAARRGMTAAGEALRQLRTSNTYAELREIESAVQGDGGGGDDGDRNKGGHAADGIQAKQVGSIAIATVLFASVPLSGVFVVFNFAGAVGAKNGTFFEFSLCLS
jgi:MFS family permease